MTQSHTGGCRCSAIRYQCQGDPLDSRICHCRDCQYASGGAFSAVAFFAANAVTIEGHARSYAVKGSAGLTVNRHFCEVCGTPVYSTLTEMPGLIFIKLGTLDNPDAIQPNGHMWWDSKLHWPLLTDNLEKLPGNPPL